MKKGVFFLGLVLGLLYSLIIVVSLTMKDGVVIGIGLSVVLSVMVGIILETNKQKKANQSFINCIKRINHNDLMFNVTEMTVKRDKKTEIELHHLISNLKSSFKEQVEISRTINEISDQLTSIAVKLDSSMESVASSAQITSSNGEKQL